MPPTPAGLCLKMPVRLKGCGMRRGPLWGLIVSVVLAAYCGVCTGPWQGVIIGAASGAAGAAANGGNIFKGALLGAISGAAFAAIGGSGWDAPFKALGHGAVGGIMSVLQGGKFGHGFASAGLTKLLNVNSIVGDAAGLVSTTMTIRRVIIINIAPTVKEVTITLLVFALD